jgi:outer membrane protein assembly factor BamB
MTLPSCCALLLTLALGASPSATLEGDEARWPSFRGPNASGLGTGDPPVEFDAVTGKGVRWRTAIPGLAHSSPVVWGQRVFVTSAVRLDGEARLSSLYGSPGYGAGESVEAEGPHAFRLYCLALDSGEVLWERTAHEGVPKVKRHPKSSHANPTPAVDAERVVASFGSEGVHAFDHQGEPLWSVDLGVLDCGAPRVEDPAAYQWGYASTPVNADGLVLVQADVQDQSFLTALDAASGEERWRVLRDEDPSWGTPTVAETSALDGPQVVVNGYKHIGGYDLESGEEIWKLVGGGDVPVPTPVVSGGLIFITSAHGPEHPIHAIFTDAEGLLELGSDSGSEGISWSNRRGIYMQTPLVLDGLLYACSDGGVLGCYDAFSGDEVYRERLGDGQGGFSGSAVAAGGRLYFSGEAGDVLVVRAGREFELLATNPVGDTLMATPALAGDVLLLRTRHHLLAIGE